MQCSTPDLPRKATEPSSKHQDRGGGLVAGLLGSKMFQGCSAGDVCRGGFGRIPNVTCKVDVEDNTNYSIRLLRVSLDIT